MKVYSHFDFKVEVKNLPNILTNPLFLISISIVIGKILGKFSIKKFSLGSSAILFAGIFVIELVNGLGYNNVDIPPVLFNLSLNSFVTVVALIASSTLVSVFKKYGAKFILLGFVVRATAALVVFIFMKIFPDLVYQLTGVSVGAVTSSPGFGNAIEIAELVGKSHFVTIGYVISYMPGVISVITFGKLAAKKYQQTPDYIREQNIIQEEKKEIKTEKDFGFNIVKFMIVTAFGLLIGSFNISLGQGMSFSLGGTGGCLFSALIFGAFFKEFKFNPVKLDVIKELSICSFLAIIGLKYGHSAIQSILGDGLILLPVAILVSISSISSGLFFGKYIFKMDMPLLAGGICGAMTSTPGLASTLESFEDNRVVTGYGATYPFGLIFAIVFINILI